MYNFFFRLLNYIPLVKKIKFLLRNWIEFIVSKAIDERLIVPATSVSANYNLELKGNLSPENFCFSIGSSIVIPEGSLLKIGKECYIGRYVEIGPITKISIGDYSSIQDRCVILGDVFIGRYCTFAPNIFISSGMHYFDFIPWSNIKDQDEHILSNKELKQKHYNRPVTIEDDVWLGVNVVIMKGVRVGKGSVIGSSSVVVYDIPPYSVAVGSPAKVIKKRLEFKPPIKISWENEEELPYFYEGFLVSNQERNEYKINLGLAAKSKFRMALDFVGKKYISVEIKKLLAGNLELRYGNKTRILESHFLVLTFDLGNVNSELFEFDIESENSIDEISAVVVIKEAYTS